MKQSTLRQIYELPLGERILLAQNILESIADEQYGSSLSAADKAKLDRRLALIEKYPDRGSSWSTVKRRLHRKSK